ncbi:HD domain-containing protein [candidate division KSB1 bacterium]|nr:HD domain-containing protein [candidate division KSB1 bacterium]
MKKNSKNISGIRFESANKIMKKLDHEPSHVIQVCNLALQLFDRLKTLHCCCQDDRDMLEAAALLHDIGYIKGAKGHHKHSLNMIAKSELDGWDKQEKLVIGNIARYHTKSLPKAKHKKFSALAKENQKKVLKLAALLRLADGLDRSHSDAIKNLNCEIGKNKIKVDIESRGHIALELDGFKKKRDLFVKVYGRKIVIGKINDSWHIEPRHFVTGE